jgi:biopolymer transport protein ExbB
VPHIAADYLKHLAHDTLREEVLKTTGSYALEKVESRLRVLAALTHIAPLLGLLGTVTGLVSAFHQIELRGGQVQPGDLAAGIWEALITTVFGLVIAIPCMAAYHGFEGAADRIARQMQLIISELNAFFGQTSRERFTTEDPEQTEAAMRAVE